ncbi:endopeptidase [Paraburkholderia atlantica]|uniref:Bbp19 family protein n=1 Tax=Paraburkholderia atlantica TaxID=2654982 RepID=UPI003D240C65
MDTSEFNPTDLHALDERRREASEQSRFELQIELDDVAWLMSGKRGRRFVWRLLGDTRLYQQSFDGNTNWSIFYEGKRSVALKLLSQIHSIKNGAELYAQMLTEARTKEKANA